MSESRVSVVEYTDPGCPWSWASEPNLRWVRRRYEDLVEWRRVFGVQINDLAEAFPGKDPVADVEDFRSSWLEIARHTGAPVSDRLVWMHVSTRPACTAVKAAALVSDDIADRVLRRLREAVFVLGTPADTWERLETVLEGTPGLDLDRLRQDMVSEEIRAAIEIDYMETREPHPSVIGLTEPPPNPGAARPDGDALRYSFPTLVIRGPEGERVVPGWREPEVYQEAFEAVDRRLRNAVVERLTPTAALDRYRSLTLRDLDLLTGQRNPPADAVRLDTATSSVWLHMEDAESRGLAGLLAG